MSCYLGFVGNESALCRALSVLLGLAVHYFVLHGFCWYWQCIVSCCLDFVCNGSALYRAAKVLFVLALHCVVLHGFC